MKSFFIKIFLLLFGLEAFATSQRPDKLFYKGIEYDLFSNPLEIYFEKNPDKRPRHVYGGVVIESTDLWRGYVATFEIKDNKLIVKDIQIHCVDTAVGSSQDISWESVIIEVFPEQKEIEVDWFTGLLVLPLGNLMNYVHMGYGSTYENYILLEINEGNLKTEKHFNYIEYENFKGRQFQAFKQTKEYKKIKKDLIKDGNSKKFIDSFLRSYVTDYTLKILIE